MLQYYVYTLQFHRAFPGVRKKFVHCTKNTVGRPITRVEFLELLNKWNAADPEAYSYYQTVDQKMMNE